MQLTKSNKVPKVIAVALLATNLLAASLAYHYREESLEAKQDFQQALAEQDRIEDEMLEECEGRIDDLLSKPQHKEIKDLFGIIKIQSEEIIDLRNELSDQAATIRTLKPELFKGKQASSYSFKIKKCTTDADCCAKNPEVCAADNYLPY